MVRQSPRSAKKTNTPVGSLANNDLNAQVSHHNRNQKTSPEGKIAKSSTCKAGVKNGRKRVKSEADGGSENTSLEKRVSARIQTKQIEKELLVRRRVELLDNQEIGSNVKKTRTRRSNDVDAASEAVGGSEIMSHGVVGENSIVGNGCTTNLAEKSDHAKAKETLRLFNKHYLHFIQVEEMRCRNSEAERKASKGSKSKNKTPVEATKIPVKRPDLKAISKMIQLKEVLYPKKRIGNIPGIVVGHQFYSRAEMVVVGFHSHWLNGIDYMGSSYSKLYSNYTFPIAVAIVLSGMYEDDLDNADDVVYTGQGGHNLTGNKRQIRDQVLERGNLALKNCVEQCVPVRVVRGHGSTSSYCGKVYTYDGLYKVVQYWAEKGISGFTIFKYRLRRLEGQPLLTTNQVHFTCGRAPQSVSEIRGLVCEDITGGQEDVPIPATNMVDDPAVAPIGFTYCKSIRVAQNVKLPMTVNGCSCEGTCMDPKTCSCAMLNGPDFPYVHRDGGRLIEARDVVFECGPKCGCGPGCVNRTSQRGLRYRLEVYRTPKKGWAVRCWDFIPSGAPVCEYTGIIKRTEDMDHIHENNYIFDIDCLQTMRGLDGRERRSKDASLQAISSSDRADLRPESVPEFCIDAGSTGNIARFINHSCEPNLFVQCVLSSHSDMRLARVMLFAADNIPPMQELTYDYGYVIDSVYGTDGKIKQMPCFCGAADCRKRLF